MKKYLFVIFIFWAASVAAQKDSAAVSPSAQPTVHASDFKNPQFPGGQKAFSQEILKNFRTTVPASLNIKKAKASAVFIVETDGSMSNIKIESYEHESIRNEFIKALKMISTKWTPAEENGIKVRARMRQPLVFVLE